MPIFAAAAIPFWGAAAKPIADVAGGLISAHGATSGAKTAADAATQAAEIKAKSDAEALAFQKQQAEADWRNAEATRKANYDQSLARMNRLGSLYDILGMSRPSMPAYVPTQDPMLSGAPTAPAGGPPAAPGATTSAPSPSSMPMSGDPVTDAVAKNYASLGAKPTGPGSGPTDIAYMVQKINETGGLTPQNQAYWFGPQGRIAKELAQASSGAAPSSIASMTGRLPVNNPMQPTSLATPALFQAPQRTF